MSDLVKRLRSITEIRLLCKDCYISFESAEEAAYRIEELEAENACLLANAKYNAELLVVYHQWCLKHGCAPSSSDLIAAKMALAGEKKDESDR